MTMADLNWGSTPAQFVLTSLAFNWQLSKLCHAADIQQCFPTQPQYFHTSPAPPAAHVDGAEADFEKQHTGSGFSCSFLPLQKLTRYLELSGRT